MIAIGLATRADAAEVERIVNAAYQAGEAGIWRDGWRRISREDVEAMIDCGQIAVARAGGRIVGSVRVRRLDAETAELGVLAVDPEAFGNGSGRALLAFAERHHDTDSMQLELLVPRDAPHPSKQRLHAWYSRLGYREIGRRDFAGDYPGEGELLAGPADLVTYGKSLRAAPAT